jgi:hypothetical protein
MLTYILKVYPYFGWIGSLVILTGIVISAAAYRGKAGERYQFWNHFISELGEVGISRLAAVFNTGVILGGLLFLPMMVGLGVTLGSTWGWLAMAAGIIAALSSSFVGIFPMSNLDPHRVAAMTFFRTGLLTVLLFTIAIFAQPAGERAIPLVVNVFGVLSILTYALFLALVGRKMDRNNNPNYILDPNAMPDRPRFWRTAFLEWMVFFTTILWFLVVSII